MVVKGSTGLIVRFDTVPSHCGHRYMLKPTEQYNDEAMTVVIGSTREVKTTLNAKRQAKYNIFNHCAKPQT